MRALPLLLCLLATPCAAQVPPRQRSASDYIARRAHAADLWSDAEALWAVGLTVHFGAAAVAGVYAALGVDRGLDCLLECAPIGAEFAYAWLAVSAVGLGIALTGAGFSIASAWARAEARQIYGALMPTEGGARASLSFRF